MKESGGGVTNIMLSELNTPLPNAKINATYKAILWHLCIQMTSLARRWWRHQSTERQGNGLVSQTMVIVPKCLNLWMKHEENDYIIIHLSSLPVHVNSPTQMCTYYYNEKCWDFKVIYIPIFITQYIGKYERTTQGVCALNEQLLACI